MINRQNILCSTIRLCPQCFVERASTISFITSQESESRVISLRGSARASITRQTYESDGGKVMETIVTINFDRPQKIVRLQQTGYKYYLGMIYETNGNTMCVGSKRYPCTIETSATNRETSIMLHCIQPVLHIL